MRISDWSSDVCSSDLDVAVVGATRTTEDHVLLVAEQVIGEAEPGLPCTLEVFAVASGADVVLDVVIGVLDVGPTPQCGREIIRDPVVHVARVVLVVPAQAEVECQSSAEHTSELQSLMRISYAVFCL